jgi:hypothetical protein
MSWSFSGVGKPDALKRALDNQLSQYSGQSKEEFEQAAPHLKSLLDCAHDQAAVSVSANGHATFVDGKRTHAHVQVTIQQIGTLYE